MEPLRVFSHKLRTLKPKPKWPYHPGKSKHPKPWILSPQAPCVTKNPCSLRSPSPATPNPKPQILNPKPKPRKQPRGFALRGCRTGRMRQRIRSWKEAGALRLHFEPSSKLLVHLFCSPLDIVHYMTPL